MHRLIFCRYLILLVLLLGLPLSTPADDAKKTLVAVIPADFPPTYYRDPATGLPAGLAVDVMNEVAKQAGLTISYRFAKPWQEIEELVRTGEADLIPLRVMNETNQQTLLFTTPLDISYLHYVVRVDDLHQKPGPDSKIGVINNSTALEYLKKQPVKNQLVTYDSLEHMLIDLLSGRIDTLLTVTDNLKNLADRLRLEDRFKIVNPAVIEVKRGIAVQAGNRQLQERLNKAIESFYSDRESTRIYQKWLSKPPPYWTAKRTAIALGSLLILLVIALVSWRNRTLSRINRQLKAEQAFLQTMIDAIPDFIFFKDRNSVYLGGNRAFAEQVHGCGKEKLVGHTDAELLKDQELADYFIKTDQEVMDSGNQLKIEVQMPLKDGRTLLAESIKTPFRNEVGEVIGVIGIGRDITERHLQLQQLEEARKRAEAANLAKSQFLANMSHEIRTPLNGVLGMAQLLAMSNLDQEQQEHLNMIQVSGENLLVILNDILDLAKIEADMLQLNPVSFSPAHLVEGAIHFYRQPCLQKKIQLQSELDQNLPALVIGDVTRLKQILFNLLGNAVKFTPQGQITLSCSLVNSTPQNVTLRFAVKDTGIGISSKDQERIFKPFEQADNSSTRTFGGTGLGLAICRRLTEIMGGTLSVESTVGAGSCFTLEIDLGRMQEDMPLSAQKQDRPAASNGKETLSILVVEDNDVSRLFMSKLLHQLGYQVMTAGNGRQALESMEQNCFDLVFMDIQMPVLDGTQTLQSIRMHDEQTQCHTPVIALTAHAMNGDKERFMKQGFDGYLPKPLQSGDLKSIIDSFLSKNRTR